VSEKIETKDKFITRARRHLAGKARDLETLENDLMHALDLLDPPAYEVNYVCCRMQTPCCNDPVADGVRRKK
jgi:hypothetical protein